MTKKILIEKIKDAKKTPTFKLVRDRIRTFKNLHDKNNSAWFCELCYCLLTANYNARGALKIQAALLDDFGRMPISSMKETLKEHGHRFPNKRAEFICEARKHKTDIKKIITSMDEKEARNWLADNIKGIGMKEASHFLRNVGYDNSAIIDFHIIDILVEHGIIEISQNLNKKKYIEIEKKLKEIALECGLTLAELDLYLWYFQTGKILK